MIDWIVEQQGVLSISLVLLIVFERGFTKKISAKLAYGLWLLVPLVLLCNNLPKHLTTMTAKSFSHYVVSINSVNRQIESNWLMTLWIIGMAIILTFIFTRYIQLYRSVEAHKNIVKTPCFSSRLVSSPVILGVLSPKILLPDDFQQLFCKHQQEMVIEHERTHIQQGDHLWNVLALALLIVFWFNPLVWIGARSFRINQELACDTKVLKAKSKHQKLLYAKALLKCAEHRSLEQSLLPSWGDKNTLLKRLDLIKQPAPYNKYLIGLVLLIVAALSINTLLANLSAEQKTSVMINDIKPSKRVEPIYPHSAIENQQEGSVILKFDITASGKTNNIEIVQSFPQDIFDVSAVEALKHWEYKSHLGKGLEESIKGSFVQLDFRLYRRSN